MKRRMMSVLMLTGLAGVAVVMGSSPASADRTADAVVYVRSQGLYYDTLIVTELPPEGNFQLLEMGPNGLETDLGPGDVGYLGGRWIEDFDGDGNFSTFLCPLLPPGRANP